MAVVDIPTKIIERTESLVETKMNVTAELTKLIHAPENSKNKPVTENQVFKTFQSLYDRIEELLPQNALDTLMTPDQKRTLWKKYLLYGGGSLILLVGAAVYLYFNFM